MVVDDFRWLRSNSLRSTERKLFYPSIPVNDQTNKEYGRIRKRIRMQFNSLHTLFFFFSLTYILYNKQKANVNNNVSISLSLSLSLSSFCFFLYL